MARANPDSWLKYERFAVSFEAVASGSERLVPEQAAMALSRELSRRLAPAEEAMASGSIFLVGKFGSAATHTPRQIFAGIRHALDMAGSFRVNARGVSPGGRFVRTTQIIDRLPVFGAELTLHLDHRSQAYALTGNPLPGAVMVAEPSRSIGPEGAIEIVAEALDEPESLDSSVTEVLLPIEDHVMPAFHVSAFTLEPFGTWYGFVSKEGELLALYNVSSAFGSKSTSLANAYEINPLRSTLAQVELPALRNPAEYLDSQAARVWGPGGSRVRSAGDGFLYAQDVDEFDQPQLYFFLTKCRSVFESICGGGSLSAALTSGSFNPMVGIVHVPQARNNAFYDVKTCALYFGDIELAGARRHTSRSLDIVLHEFGHAVSDAICKLARASQHQACRAMSEGYSDYFACSALDNPIMGDYFEDDPAGFRNCGNKRKFPPGYAGEEHNVGEVWAGLLWSLRAAAGKSAADRIVLQSLGYLAPWRTILQGFEALIQADRLLFLQKDGTGQHEAMLREEFERRRP